MPFSSSRGPAPGQSQLRQGVGPCAETAWEPLPLLAHPACSYLDLKLGKLWDGGFGLKGESSME